MKKNTVSCMFKKIRLLLKARDNHLYHEHVSAEIVFACVCVCERAVFADDCVLFVFCSCLPPLRSAHICLPDRIIKHSPTDVRSPLLKIAILQTAVDL